jgi:acetyl-CoA C-acetyltransferase
MLERVRGTEKRGMVTALGWYATKHAIGVYGAEPGPTSWAEPRASLQPAIDAMPHPAFAERPEGAATVETYTIVHDRSGGPEHGVVIGRLEDGRRFLSLVDGDRATLEDLESREGVGRPGRVRPGDDGVNRFVVG